jgi:hypothetical protein
LGEASFPASAGVIESSFEEWSVEGAAKALLAPSRGVRGAFALMMARPCLSPCLVSTVNDRRVLLRNMLSLNELALWPNVEDARAFVRPPMNDSNGLKRT